MSTQVEYSVTQDTSDTLTTVDASGASMFFLQWSVTACRQHTAKQIPSTTLCQLQVSRQVCHGAAALKTAIFQEIAEESKSKQ